MTDQTYCPMFACYGGLEVLVTIDGIEIWVCHRCAKNIGQDESPENTPQYPNDPEREEAFKRGFDKC